jgi:rhodanese-related sulfurtransferase
MSVANTSKHLQALVEARLVRFRKEKNYVIYRLSDQKVIDLLMTIKSVAEKQLAEINLLRNEFVVKPGQMETITLEELHERMNNDITVIDVRPREEYEAGHIDGSISVPISELNGYLQQFSSDQSIVAYCHGPYCAFATQAVELLQSKGYKAIRLEAGLHEWRKSVENQIH